MMRTDFETLSDGDKIKLWPTFDNPLHKYPVDVTYSGGYFYCEGSNPVDGPDYYFGDVLKYNEGFTTEAIIPNIEE